MELTYFPEIFLQPTEERARAIILTPEVGLTTDERWEQETAWLQQFIERLPAGLTLDYGCGIGRLAKLVNHPVLGVDIAWTMRHNAERHVNRADFSAITPQMLSALVDAGLRVSAALTVWCLQHAPQPRYDINLIHRALLPGGKLLMVNHNAHRRIPVMTDTGEFNWASDKEDIENILSVWFTRTYYQELPACLACEGSALTLWTRGAGE